MWLITRLTWQGGPPGIVGALSVLAYSRPAATTVPLDMEGRFNTWDVD